MSSAAGLATRLAGAVVVALVLAACGSGSSGEDADGAITLRVAAASDLQFALEEVIELVEADNPAYTVDVTYGSSGQFLQQIQNGAPFDLYLSADVSYPRELVEADLAEEADLFSYALGRLVLWVPEGSDLDPTEGMQTLLDPSVRRISIANPEHAPYGQAAVAAMRSSGTFEAAEPRLALGENVSQAAEFVQSGNADIGLVALSLVLSDPLQGVGEWWEVPERLHPPLDQGGVVLSRSEHPDAARAVRDAMLEGPGSAIMTRYGFVLPEE